MKRSFVPRALPFIILIGGFALRLYRLGANSLWYDETVSVFLARSDLGELLRHTAGDIHPPLYYLLLFVWGRLAGWSGFSVAFLSLSFGVLLIALAYRAAREWFGASPALAWVPPLAALLLAVSPYHVWYSQEVRMYTLGAALGLASVLFLSRLLRQLKLSSLDVIAYVLCTVLGLYTLYYFVFLILFEWVWVLVTLGRTARLTAPRSLWRIALAFLASQIAVVLVYLPWLPIAFRQATDPPVPPWREFVALPQVLLESYSALAFGQSVNPVAVAPLLALLAIPLALALYRDARKSLGSAPSARDARHSAGSTRHSTLENRQPKPENQQYPQPSWGAISNQKSIIPTSWFLFSYTFIPLAAIYFLSLWKPLYHVRYVMTYSPAFYILASYALVTVGADVVRRRAAPRLRRFLVPAAAVVAAVYLAATAYSLVNYWYNPQYARDDLRSAVAYLADRWRPGDAILVNAGYAYPALAYYFPGAIRRERLTQFIPSSTDAPSGESVPLVLQTGSIGGAPGLGWGDPLSDFYATTEDETRAALDRVVQSHPRVWIFRIYDTVTDPDGVIRRYFDEHATLFDDQAFTGESQLRVQGYLTAPTDVLPAAAQRVQHSFGDRVELTGVQPGPTALRAGQPLDVVLYWRLRQPVNYNYSVSLQLLDQNGQNVAQSDETPLSDLLPMTRWQTGAVYRQPMRLVLPYTLPPGDYRAVSKLYNPRTLEVLGAPFELGEIHVAADSR